MIHQKQHKTDICNLQGAKQQVLNILGIISLNKINNWEDIKGNSLWLNLNFDDPKQKRNIDHWLFSFKHFL